MEKYEKEDKKNFAMRHPIMINVVIILLVAIFGIIIAYLSLTLFTKHGQKDQVPNVVGLSYTEAIEKLHDSGFKIEIRDSLYLDDVKPGYVVEQYPNALSIVKPGRRIFLYINAVNPKQMVIDPSSDHPGSPALEGIGLRQAIARLDETGFKNVKIIYKPGVTDRVVRILANGKVVRVMEKVPINASIILEVYDNSGQARQDSIINNRFYEEKIEERELNPDLYQDDENEQIIIEPIEDNDPVEFIEY